MMTVNYRELQKKVQEVTVRINEGLNTELGERDTWHRSIELYDMGNGFDQPVKMGVNWSAIGTVEPAKAGIYAKWLAVAAQEAENFIYNGYEIEV